jgi:hypothetical protein
VCSKTKNGHFRPDECQQDTTKLQISRLLWHHNTLLDLSQSASWWNHTLNWPEFYIVTTDLDFFFHIVLIWQWSNKQSVIYLGHINNLVELYFYIVYPKIYYQNSSVKWVSHKTPEPTLSFYLKCILERSQVALLLDPQEPYEEFTKKKL